MVLGHVFVGKTWAGPVEWSTLRCSIPPGSCKYFTWLNEIAKKNTSRSFCHSISDKEESFLSNDTCIDQQDSS
jgi:hypothetical protein